MKKNIFSVVLFSIFFLVGAIHELPLHAADTKIKNYDGEGEIVNVDPALRQVTIKHGVIKGYSEEAESEFMANDGEMLRGLSRHDFVHFTLREDKGHTELDQIAKIGEVEPEKEGIQIGQAVQDVVVATGEVAKAVTSPIEPVHGAVSDAMSGTQEVTGAVLEDATFPESKKKF